MRCSTVSAVNVAHTALSDYLSDSVYSTCSSRSCIDNINTIVLVQRYSVSIVVLQ